MKFAERIVFSVYTWDRNRNFTIGNATIHSRMMLSLFLMVLSMDIYCLVGFLSKKWIYVSGRFFLDKKIDWIILGAVFFFVAWLITSCKKWEQAYKDEVYPNLSVVNNVLIILGGFGVF